MDQQECGHVLDDEKSCDLDKGHDGLHRWFSEGRSYVEDGLPCTDYSIVGWNDQKQVAGVDI